MLESSDIDDPGAEGAALREGRGAIRLDRRRRRGVQRKETQDQIEPGLLIPCREVWNRKTSHTRWGVTFDIYRANMAWYTMNAIKYTTQVLYNSNHI